MPPLPLPLPLPLPPGGRPMVLRALASRLLRCRRYRSPCSKNNKTSMSSPSSPPPSDGGSSASLPSPPLLSPPPPSPPDPAPLPLPELPHSHGTCPAGHVFGQQHMPGGSGGLLPVLSGPPGPPGMAPTLSTSLTLPSALPSIALLLLLLLLLPLPLPRPLLPLPPLPPPPVPALLSAPPLRRDLMSSPCCHTRWALRSRRKSTSSKPPALPLPVAKARLLPLPPPLDDPDPGHSEHFTSACPLGQWCFSCPAVL